MFESVNNQRLLSFEFVLKNLLEWQREIKKSDDNDLSTLKAIKLLFFLTAVNSNRNSENFLVTNVFKNFVAMPYGHVESIVYDEIKERKGLLNHFSITNRKCTVLDNTDLISLEAKIDNKTKNEIISSVLNLRKINPNLVLLSAFELVDLSHYYYSWQKTFTEAKNQGLNSLAIDPSDIINEDKMFSLQVF